MPRLERHLLHEPARVLLLCNKVFLNSQAPVFPRHSPSTLSPNLQSLGPDCDSGAQFALQDPEMTSVKLEDCSQTLKLNVNIKDEEEEEKIGKCVNHGKSRHYLRKLDLHNL